MVNALVECIGCSIRRARKVRNTKATLQIVTIKKARPLIVNRHADEDAEEACLRTMREMGQFAERHAIVPVLVADSVEPVINLSRRPNVAAELAKMKQHRDGSYEVPEDSSIGCILKTHARWSEEIHTTCSGMREIDLSVRPAKIQDFFFVPAYKMRDIAAYIDSYYDEEVKRRAAR